VRVARSSIQVNARFGPLPARGGGRGGNRVSEPSASGSRDKSPTWARLEDQLTWYDQKAIANQRKYRLIKVLQLLAAASVPVAAALSAAHWLLAAQGGVILVLEGLQQLGQYHEQWISYRATCEQLKREKFLFLAEAKPYAGKNRERVLAVSVERLVSQEHVKWASTQEEAVRAEQEEERGH
jgi:hypothetical protein